VPRNRHGRELGRAWESLVERQIREAMEAGAFDDLPHQGVPLPLEDDSASGDRAMAHRMLRDAGMAPPWIETDKEVRALLARRDLLLDRASRVSPLARHGLRREFLGLLEAADRAILRLNGEAPTDRQHRRPLDRPAELARFDEASRDADQTRRPRTG
jgi:hypothetical protein